MLGFVKWTNVHVNVSRRCPRTQLASTFDHTDHASLRPPTSVVIALCSDNYITEGNVGLLDVPKTSAEEHQMGLSETFSQAYV